MLNYLLQSKKFSPLRIGLLLFLLLWMSAWLGVKMPAYCVYVDGQEKFIAQNSEDVNNALNRMVLENKKVNPESSLISQLEFKKVFANKKGIVTADNLEQVLNNHLRFECLATAIVVDGKTIARVKDQQTAEKILNDLKTEYSWVDEGEKLLGIAFAEKIQLQEVYVAANDIIAPEKAYELIKTGTDNPEKYQVKEGDSLWLIARRNDMYVNEIVVANKLKTEKLSLGQELLLIKSKPYINVVSQVEGKKVETIPYETQVITDKNAANSIRVKQDGKNGEKSIVYVATKSNGVVTEREIKQETILKEAINKVVVKGSRVTVVASRGGSGNLEWPSYGPITQYYRGSGHTGLDIAAKKGTPIKAADSGTVTYARYQGGYGNFIIVDHGNGIVTRYAHCSTINVSVGQGVAKGETIATLGSTGNSSGPHLHFEVLAGGSFQNPLNYLP